MTELMQQLASRKVAWRKELAARPIGEKLRMLEQMVAETKAISATRPPGPANPVRGKARVRGAEGQILVEACTLE